MTRVESGGSFWFLDDDAGTYTRTPKHEGPRDHFESAVVDVLVDLVPHPMNLWYVSSEGWGKRLYIVVPTSTHRVNAPLSNEEFDRLLAAGYGKERRLDACS